MSNKSVTRIPLILYDKKVIVIYYKCVYALLEKQFRFL